MLWWLFQYVTVPVHKTNGYDFSNFLGCIDGFTLFHEFSPSDLSGEGFHLPYHEHMILVGGWPLQNMRLSIGMMTFQIYGKQHVPNHQPGYVVTCCYCSTSWGRVRRFPLTSLSHWEPNGLFPWQGLQRRLICEICTCNRWTWIISASSIAIYGGFLK